LSFTRGQILIYILLKVVMYYRLHITNIGEDRTKFIDNVGN